MRLYNFDPSPNPLKIRLALAELNLSYENKEIILFKGEQKSEEFLKINALGKVPVLEEGNLLFRESNAILVYLGKEYGKDAFWPKDTYKEIEAMQWLFFESSHVAPNFGPIWFNKFVAPKIGMSPFNEGSMSRCRDSAEWALDKLNKHLTGNKYILGEQFSLVDCSLGTQIATLKETDLNNKDKWPKINDYLDRIISRDSWLKAKGIAIWDN